MHTLYQRQNLCLTYQSIPNVRRHFLFNSTPWLCTQKYHFHGQVNVNMVTYADCIFKNQLSLSPIWLFAKNGHNTTCYENMIYARFILKPANRQFDMISRGTQKHLEYVGSASQGT